MTRWSICTTVKAPTDQVLAFVAHHLDIGADEIWLYFDDPEDVAASAAEKINRVKVTRCDATYWSGFRWGRPKTHQNRQGQNARRSYGLTTNPWLCHIDVDEFIVPQIAVSSVLDATAAGTILIRMAPWEALFDPNVAEDVFTARHFRSALKGTVHMEDRAKVFGTFAFLMPTGMLSHAVGKCFFKVGVKDFNIRLHGADLKGERHTVPDFQQALPLLHFHAQSKKEWLERLDFRLERGAYQHNLGLVTYLDVGGKSGRSAFYDEVQTATPAMLHHLRSIGALIEVDLTLRPKMAAMLGDVWQTKPA